MKIMIPNYINTAINVLENAGFEAFVVGGCVRDALLKKTPQDYDITTSATPKEIISLFPHTVPTGIKHGTITVVFENDETTEITTFRTEGNYSDSRHPENVTFVKNIEEDLSRRDFTVNAMAYSQKNGLIDPFGGLADLENKVLRAVGIPALRFSEDALQILRLFRFSSQLEFKIEDNTYDCALKLAKNLSNISRERIRDELIKGLCGKNPEVLKELIATDCLSFLGIGKNCFNFDNLNKTSNCHTSRFSYFCFINDLHPLKIAQNLRCSKVFGKTCENICLLLKRSIPTNKTEIKQILKTFPINDFNEYLNTLCPFQNVSKINSFLNEIIENNEAFSLSQLSVNGNDLQKFGIKDKEIKIVLDKLLDFVIKNPEANTKEQLLELVSK